MRDVPALMTQVWNAGDFTGAFRPIARVTLQKPRIRTHRFGDQVYATLPFGEGGIPMEIRNVKRVHWDRSIDADVATATIEFYNVRPLDLGVIPDREFEPGWLTPHRGSTEASPGWGHFPNEWANMLMPDNVLRTYEGYGFDATKPPEKDPHLVQTGVWMIDDVNIRPDGLISVTCRDIGRMLTDHLIHRPVVPKDWYPLSFSAVPKESGFYAPGADQTEAEEWLGPSDPPPSVVAQGEAGGIGIAWGDPPEIPPGEPLPEQILGRYVQPGELFKSSQGYFARVGPEGPDRHWYHVTGEGQLAGARYLYGKEIEVPDEHIGPISDSLVRLFGGERQIERYIPRYELLGFRVYLDGVVRPNFLDRNARSVTLSASNGTVHFVEVAAIYQELNSGLRRTTDRSAAIWVRPNTGGPVIDLFSTGLNDPDGFQEVNGWLRWTYTGTGVPITWQVIFYRGTEKVIQTYQSPATTGSQVAVFQTGRGNLRPWNVLIYGTSGGAIGKGDVALRTQGGDGELYGAPSEPVEPPEPGPAKGRAAATGTGHDSTVMTGPLRDNLVPLQFLASSNGSDAPVFGSTPWSAIDGDYNTHWISKGYDRPDPGYAMQWIEFSAPTLAMTRVRYRSLRTQYRVYLSVANAGGWIQHDPRDVIPYAPRSAEDDNGAGIPFVEALTQGPAEGPYDINLRRPLLGVKRIRLTFVNLQDFGVGLTPYRAGLRDVQAFGLGVGESTAGLPEGSTYPDPVTTAVEDTTSTKLNPARIVGGAGEKPGIYEDYTDIVKLMCAWGGFFWPQKGRVYASDGTFEEYDFGRAPYNLGPNIDPVLGSQGGRVWGDFEIIGTAGISDLPEPQFDKKTLMDAISYVRDIVGFLFHIDEEGAVAFRSPNIWSVGNDILLRSERPRRTSAVVTLDEGENLLDLGVKLSSRNVREHIFVSDTTGDIAASARGWNPNPIGMRRVSGWTDQHFASVEECQLMADLISLRQLFTYRGASTQIPGYPRIQINDQVRIVERVTSEAYLHYVKGVSSDLDHESGVWTYDLETHWLGERPFDKWAFNPIHMSGITNRYLELTGRVDMLRPTYPPPQRTNPNAHQIPGAP